MIYEVGVKELHEEIGPAYWFIFKGYELLVCVDSVTQRYIIPSFDNIKHLHLMISDIQYLGRVDGKDSYTASLSGSMNIQGHVLKGLRYLYGDIDDDWYWLANRACHLNNWRQKSRFCGCCGELMHPSLDEVAMLCRSCGNIVYPRISPAVIVAVTKEDQILLAHATKFSGKIYSVLAGYVEPGETLEECIKREVMEEVGLHVKNIKYFTSQPWPYPDTLMTAFTAEYESGEIKVDKKEIEDAKWYSRDDLPELPSNASVARKLINAWMNKK